MKFLYYWIELDGEGKHMIMTDDTEQADKAMHEGRQIFMRPIPE